MIYLNLNIPQTVRSPDFLGCEPVDQATWLKLITYCCEQENGGTITACKDWGDRRWMATCTVTAAEVQRQCPLWAHNGDNVTVWQYPISKEKEIKAMRKGGSKGGKRRAFFHPSREASSPPSTERKGKEEERNKGRGIGKEGEPPEFGSFWDSYPRKEGKGQARKAFTRAIKSCALDKMLEALNRQKRSEQWTKDGGKFIPHPATWLNGERWEDQTVTVISPEQQTFTANILPGETREERDRRVLREVTR